MATNLKDLIDKIKSTSVESEEKEEVKEEEESFDDTDDYVEVDGDCAFLSEEGLCLEGCSCTNVGVEEECPFLSNGDFETCCCYEPYDDSEEYEDESE